MEKSLIFLCSSLLLVSIASAAAADLTVGFYRSTCPRAEDIVRSVVSQLVASNPGLAAGLIRMHFHDCFVRGCDASVLLEGTGAQAAEREHPANRGSLRGFEIIDQAKAELEAACPGTVSCADVLAFAARDGSNMLGGVGYSVPAGRRDGTVSSFGDVGGNIPAPSFNLEQLVQTFARKGMTMEEMVTLSGAHSIGHAHCGTFSNRLYGFNATHPEDPSLDPAYVVILKTRCPDLRSINTVDLDPTPTLMDSLYYSELRSRRGLLSSDQTLMDSPSTQPLVLENAGNPDAWAYKFSEAMIHLGSLDVLTGSQGEIRTTCGSTLTVVEGGSVPVVDDKSGLGSSRLGPSYVGVIGLMFVSWMGLGPI